VYFCSGRCGVTRITLAAGGQISVRNWRYDRSDRRETATIFTARTGCGTIGLVGEIAPEHTVACHLY
jgi:hypothetical protein